MYLSNVPQCDPAQIDCPMKNMSYKTLSMFTTSISPDEESHDKNLLICQPLPNNTSFYKIRNRYIQSWCVGHISTSEKIAFC